MDFFRLNKPHSYLEKVTTLNRRFLRRDIFYHDLSYRKIFVGNIHNNLKIPFIIPTLTGCTISNHVSTFVREGDIKFGFYLNFNYRNGHVLCLRTSSFSGAEQMWRCPPKSLLYKFSYNTYSVLFVIFLPPLKYRCEAESNWNIIDVRPSPEESKSPAAYLPLR